MQNIVCLRVISCLFFFLLFISVFRVWPVLITESISLSLHVAVQWMLTLLTVSTSCSYSSCFAVVVLTVVVFATTITKCRVSTHPSVHDFDRETGVVVGVCPDQAY